MAPADSSAAYAEEHNQFIAKLRAFHEQRGTNFDPEPRVGAKAVNLLHLYKTVIENGGYDKVSDEKLAWRRLGQENFNLAHNNIAALAFQLKTVYYKYLAAYEIATVYGKVPPPKEILEETTARGGNLLTRSLENFRPHTNRGVSSLSLGLEGSDESGDEKTPQRERNGSEEAPGSRGTRGLRHAPPQRVLFQPETHSSRQSRHVSATSQVQQSPTQYPVQSRASSSYMPPLNTDNMSMTVTNYEPRPQMPLTLRQVITPGNNPVEFARRERAIAAAASGKPVQQPSKIMLPGSGFDGPNIYVRCLCALKSGIPAEQDYALHHLVKISMERGDKYRFESFAGLAEALVDKLLEVSSLFYNVDWQVSYMDDGVLPGPDTLDGLGRSSDILEKLSHLSQLPVDDNIQDESFSDALLQINEAALTLRNMVMLAENAVYVSDNAPLKDFLVIALNLPNLDCVVELKHYTLEIAEQLTKYMPFDQKDPLYVSLLNQLQSEDRGAILVAMKAISTISMNLEENNLLTGVPSSIVQSIIDWTLLNDEEIVHACLDFLYQYTAVVENVNFLLNEIQLEPLVNQLSRLLMYNVRVVEKEMAMGREYRQPASPHIASMPEELLVDLNRLSEPQRSSHWLKCMFEEDPHESITQIALWQAYQQQFSNTAPLMPGAPSLLPAAEFIKNVSATFVERASAQVQQGPVQKFIIKGLRFRSVPVNIHGDEFKRCLWKSNLGHTCGAWYLSPEDMYQHILKVHCHAVKQADGQFLNQPDTQFNCLWDNCRRFRTAPATSLVQIANHIKVHLPPRISTSDRSGLNYDPYAPVAKKQKYSYIIDPKKLAFKYQVTAMDERHEAAGIPLSAVLVLRNLARKIPKTVTEDVALKEGGASWVEKLFKPVEPRLFEILAHNKSLGNYMTDLLHAVRESA